MLDDCAGPLDSLGYNLIEATTNCSISGAATGDITGSDPKLEPLRNNGGLTLTESPFSGSLAINAGETPACTGPTGTPLITDQRGFPRDFNGRCDIGALEYPTSAAFIPLLRK